MSVIAACDQTDSKPWK